MKSQVCGLRVAGVIFGLATVGQLARLVIRPKILIEGFVVPLWPSLLAVVLLAALSAWLCWLSLSHPDGKPSAPPPASKL